MRNNGGRTRGRLRKRVWIIAFVVFVICVFLWVIFGRDGGRSLDFTPPELSVQSGSLIEHGSGRISIKISNPNREAVQVRVILDPERDEAIYAADDTTLNSKEWFLLGATEEKEIMVSNLIDGDYDITLVARNTNGSRGKSNVRASVSIERVAAPDLMITAFTASRQILEANQEFVLYATVQNIGSLPAGRSSIRYYRSLDAKITSEDVELYNREVSAVKAGEKVRAEYALRAPNIPGIYYYGVCVGGVEVEAEMERCANFVSLYVGELSGEISLRMNTDSTVILARKRAIIRTIIENNGRHASAASLLVYYIFPANAPTATSIARTTHQHPIPSIPAGATYDSAYLFESDANGLLGPLQIRACIFARESRNSALVCNDIQITITNQSLPELVVRPLASSATQVVAPNTPLTLTATVINSGIAHSDIPVMLRFYRSTDDIIAPSDEEIGIATVSPLTVGALETHVITVTTPSDRENSYYGACADSAHNKKAPPRCTLLNSVQIVSLPRPDIAITGARLTTTLLVSGKDLDVIVTIQNRELITTPESTIRYYRSNSPRITPTDSEIGNDSIPAIGFGGNRVHRATLPASSVRDDQFYGACIDPLHTEIEINNNCSVGIRVNVLVADLAIVVGSTVTDVSQIHFDEAITVRAEATNGALVSGASVVQFYRSADAEIDLDDMPIGEAQAVTLTAKDVSPHAITTRLPNIPDSTYYYGACVIPLNSETNIANNCTTTGQRVSVRNPFIGVWVGRNTGIKVFSTFSDGRQLNEFNIFGIEYSYDCKITFITPTRYTLSECVYKHKTYLRNVERTFRHTIAADENSFHIVAGRGRGTVMYKQ